MIVIAIDQWLCKEREIACATVQTNEQTNDISCFGVENTGECILKLSALSTNKKNT